MKNAAFNKEVIAQLRKYAIVADEKMALQPAQLSLIYKYGWFKIFVPKIYCGLELSLPEALLLEEQLAFIDGSLGWAITLCAGANLFVGYIDKKIAAQIFTKQKVCFGGSGAATGVAAITDEGYVVNGFWKYATGAPHLTHFTANCVIEKNGKPLLNNDRKPLIQSFFFKRSEVNIIEGWNTPGLKATAGHSFSVKKLYVPKDRSFIIDAAFATHEQAIYQYPFLQFAELTLAVNTLGMAKHFMQEALSILKQRRKDKKIDAPQFKYVTDEIANAFYMIEWLSKGFYSHAKTSWNDLLVNKTISTETLKQVSKLSAALVKECRKQVAAIYPYCGLAAVNGNSTIERIFRDVFTASQHTLLKYS